MTNADVAQVFNEIAVLLEIKGEDAFRVNSYRRVARTVNDLTVDINDVAARGELGDLPGVGPGSAEKIHELLGTGRVSLREQLLAEVPDSLLRLLAVPTIGPKRAAVLWKECGITSMDELKAALAAGRLATVKGFGPKTLIDIDYFRDKIASPCPAGAILLGERWLSGPSCICPEPRGRAFKGFIHNSVIGLGLYQGVEFLLASSPWELLGKIGLAWSRLQNSLQVMRRSQVYRFAMGPDSEETFRVLRQFLREFSERGGRRS